jgi:membrane protease subunit (stomatin/prohibitin family)
MSDYERVRSTGVGSDIKGTESRKTFYWPDEHKGENVIWRLPQNIMWNDNVVVREDEYGVFLRDGKVMRTFDLPDRYALTTQNLPGLQAIASKLIGIKQIGEFYWIQRREFRSYFGTTEPLTFRDIDFGVVRIRSFGQFAYKVTDPMLLITQFVGTKGMTESEEIVNWLKDQIVMILNNALGELKMQKGMGILDMPSYLQVIEQLCLAKLTSETENYGLQITKFAGLNLNLPDEVQSAIDKRGAMSALGVDYMQYQTGKTIEGIGIGASKGGDAANLAGLGVGIGAGFSMAQELSKGMVGGDKNKNFGRSANETTTSESKPPEAQVSSICRNCGNKIDDNTKFCPECGTELKTSESLVKCGNCGASIIQGSKFCGQCGAKLV